MKTTMLLIATALCWNVGCGAAATPAAEESAELGQVQQAQRRQTTAEILQECGDYYYRCLSEIPSGLPDLEFEWLVEECDSKYEICLNIDMEDELERRPQEQERPTRPDFPTNVAIGGAGVELTFSR